MNKFLSCVIAVLLVSAPVVYAGSDYGDIVVFGDSLSDPGNVFAVSGMQSVRPFSSSGIPDAPYARGGHHFSNGETWIEQLSSELKLKSGTGPALRSPAFSNYAFGAARARDAGLPLHLTTQVGLFLQSGKGIASDDLFSVYVGGNDVRDAFAKFLEVYLSTGNPLLAQAEAQVIIGEAIQSIKDNIELLAAFGATNFLVPNVPNIGVTPAIQSLGPLAVGVAADLSTGFNAALEATLSGLESGYAINITRLNVYTLINNVVADPGIADLANATESCITPDVYKGAFCTRPDEYLFWDGIHPTRAGHAYLAHAAKQALMP